MYLTVEIENTEIIRILLENDCFSYLNVDVHDKDYYKEDFFIEEDKENTNAHNNNIIFVYEKNMLILEVLLKMEIKILLNSSCIMNKLM